MSKRLFLRINFVNIIIYITISLGLSSCGVRDLATGKVAPPEVEFQGLTIYPPESQCWPLSARLRLTNPNPEPLRILGYDYEFSVEGADLVQGESVAAITLPAGGESLVEVPILLKLNAVPKALKAFLLKDKLKYELAGGVRLASVLGGLKVPFRFRGEVTRQEGLERLRGFLVPKK
jgi:LEA14-like dessication related protein